MASAPLPRLDRRAFEAMYRQSLSRVHSLARHLLGAELADDATQAVYLRAWAKRSGFRGEADPIAWLQRLARNEFLNQLRSLSRKAFEQPLGHASGNVVGQGGGHGFSEDLEQALGALPTGARCVFVLHDIEGLTHEEIAAELGVHEGTSKSQLHRARALLRETLAPWSETT